MTEPVSHAAGVMLALPVVAAAGTILGVEYLTLVFALIGGCLTLLYIERMTLLRCLGSMAGAAIIGGIIGQHGGAVVGTVAVVAALYFVPALDPASIVAALLVPIKAIISFVVGMASQKGIPALFDKFSNRGKTVKQET